MADVISVSQLNRYVKQRLDLDDALFDLALRGEIANFVQNARSGHCYFTLRDDPRPEIETLRETFVDVYRSFGMI